MLQPEVAHRGFAAQRARTLGVGQVQAPQACQQALHVRAQLDVEQRVHCRFQRRQLAARIAGAVADVGRLFAYTRGLAQLDAGRGVCRRPHEPGHGVGLALGRLQVDGDAAGVAAVLDQPDGDAVVQRARQHLRHGLERAFADQVVREGRTPQHASGFEFCPGVGQVEQVQSQRARGQRRSQVLSRHCRQSGQLERSRAELAQPLVDEPGHRLGQRQRATGKGLGATLEQQRLDGFEHELRVTSGVPGQCGGQPDAAQAGHGQRLQQRRDAVLVQRLQRHLGGLQRQSGIGAPGLQRRWHFGRPHRHQPAHAAGLGAAPQQQFDAGAVGVVQVVEQHHARARERACHGRLERAGLERGRRRGTKIRQHPRQRAAVGRRQVVP